MDNVAPDTISIFAPAKINLYLHVTERLPNGYHALDSLIAFADIGDEIILTPSDHLRFTVSGPFAGAFKGKDLEAEPSSTNLVMRAAFGLSRMTDHPLDMKVELVKNMPLGAGIGGGSADAAATVRALLRRWNMPPESLPELPAFLTQLGADVPACFDAQPLRIRGIGDKIDRIVERAPEMPIVLVYPAHHCSTPQVFSAFSAALSPLHPLPQAQTPEQLVTYLEYTRNDLTKAAIKIVPEITNALQALEAQDGALLSRMSGSGSCCFGLFENYNAAQNAASSIKESNPDWWVQEGWINRVERY